MARSRCSLWFGRYLELISFLREGIGELKALFKFQWRYVLEGAGWGLLMSLSILLVLFSPVGNAVYEQAGMVREKAEQMGVVSHFVLFGLFLSLLHSLLEEYYWRWFVFGNLHRFWKSKGLAYSVGALAFASHHIVVTTQFFAGPIGWVFGFAVGIGGAIWSWLMVRHRSIHWSLGFSHHRGHYSHVGGVLAHFSMR
jgi:membrane protease YdiL (CAAX protease family)